jgi:hypothetical protein
MRARDVIVIAPMTRLRARLALVLAGLAAIAAASFVVWSSLASTRASETSLRLATEASRRAIVDAADLRAAQQAYVAVGQGEDFWFARVGALSKDLDEVLAVFKGHLSSGEALAAAGDAAAALQDFQQVDAHARDYTHGRQLAQASDVIFGDGFDLTQKLTAAVTRAITAEAVAYDADAARIRRTQAVALASAAGIVAIVLIALVPGATPKAAETAVLLSSEPVPVSKETLDDLNDFGVVAWPSQAAPAAPAASTVDLPGVATICADLARVADTQAIPALLGRAATILDAAGIVLWIADPDGRELTPILAHGYPAQIVTRLGTLARDAANVTASAYRTGLLQTVKGDTVSNGAVAAPLVAAGGCLGVMAVEMKNGGEQREGLLAAATIIASQLSTLVGPPPARNRAEAAG